MDPNDPGKDSLTEYFVSAPQECNEIYTCHLNNFVANYATVPTFSPSARSYSREGEISLTDDYVHQNYDHVIYLTDSSVAGQKWEVPVENALVTCGSEAKVYIVQNEPIFQECVNPSIEGTGPAESVLHTSTLITNNATYNEMPNIYSHKTNENTVASFCQDNNHIDNAFNAYMPSTSDLSTGVSQNILNDSMEIFSNGYSIMNDDGLLNSMEQQRLLIERAMSPLLAAVNDIASRDLDFQNYQNNSNFQFTTQDSESAAPECDSDFITYNELKLPNAEGRNLTLDDFKSRRSQRLKCDIKINQTEMLIEDQQVPTRAFATLPSTYLILNKCEEAPYGYAVFAKREILENTKFGPIDGKLERSYETINETSTYPFLCVDNNFIIKTDNEDTSNWMRFVRLAQTHKEQNLLLYETNNKLYFKACRNIQPKHELKVGYSEDYAYIYGLNVLTEDKNWPCYECDSLFATSMELQKHLNDHETDQPVKVIRKKKRRRIFKRSVRGRIIRQTKRLRCNLDESPHRNTTEIDANVMVHLDDLNKENSHYECPLCSKTFLTEMRLKRHLVIHKRKSLKPFGCDKCPKRFVNEETLSNHLKTHIDKTTFKCPFCPFGLKSFYEMRKHAKGHLVNGFYACPHCEKKSKDYATIRRHIHMNHSTPKHKCDNCGKCFKSKSKFDQHQLKYSTVGQFPCNICGKRFKRSDKLKDHQKRIHKPDNNQHRVPPSGDYENSAFKCQICMMTFKRRGMLVNHLAKRHPMIPINSVPELNQPILKEERSYLCCYCDKSYKSSTKRKAHILKNHPGKELPLSSRFISINSIDSNEPNPAFVRKTGNIVVEPNQCSWCFKQYSSKARLVKHQRQFHKELLEESENLNSSDYITYDEGQNEMSHRKENNLLKLSSAAWMALQDETSLFHNYREMETSLECLPITPAKNDQIQIVASESRNELNSFPHFFDHYSFE